MNSRGWYRCDEENEYHIEWFELGLQTNLHSVIEVYNMNAVASIKASLEYSQKDIEELKPLASKLEEINNEIDQLNSDLSEQELKAEYLENQSRRNNIRVKGIPESEKETWEEVESKVKDAIKIKLDLEVDIESPSCRATQARQEKKQYQ